MTSDINGTVIAIQGTAVSSTAPTDGQVLVYINADGKYEAKSPGGDLSGTHISTTVSKINGTTVNTAGGSLTTGAVLRVTGSSTVDYGTVDLGNSSAITGTLPTGNQAAQSMGGDVSGTTASATVVKLQGVSIDSTAPTSGQVLEYNSGTSKWVPTALPTSLPPNGSASGDLSGTYPSPTVSKINGTTVSTAGGSLTTGKVLRVTGASTVDYGAVDLANSSAVTGTLPTGNQANQSMGGDVTGTTASATVAKLQGKSVSSTAPTDGQVLTYVSANSDWEPKAPAAGTLNSNAYFTSNGTWTCPTGVTSVLCIGAGGGGGGAGGGYASADSNIGTAGSGGGAATQQTAYVTVSPGTTYTVTIGAGGSGGSGATDGSHYGNNGNDGSATKLIISSTNYFYALGGGGAGVISAQGAFYAGAPFAGAQPYGGWQVLVTNNNYPLPPLPGGGGLSYVKEWAGMMNYIGGYSGGSAGANASGSSYGGGGGGGAGPLGAGGNGGNGSTGGAGSNGSNASVNTAAGGGGGGSGHANGNGGAGGNGGSGYLSIIW